MWIIFLAYKTNMVGNILFTANQILIKNVFRQVEHIYFTNLNTKVWGCFGIQGIGHQTWSVTDPLAAKVLQNITTNNQEEHNLYNMVIPNLISKSIKGSTTNNSLEKPPTLQGFWMGWWWENYSKWWTHNTLILSKASTTRIGVSNFT